MRVRGQCGGSNEKYLAKAPVFGPLVGGYGLGSGVCGIADALVWGGPSSVPAAVATLLPDAGVVFGLIARVPEIGEHVGPETFIL